MRILYHTQHAVLIYIITLMAPGTSLAQCNGDLPSRLLSGGLTAGFDSTNLAIESIPLSFPSLIWTLTGQIIAHDQKRNRTKN